MSVQISDSWRKFRGVGYIAPPVSVWAKVIDSAWLCWALRQRP